MAIFGIFLKNDPTAQMLGLSKPQRKRKKKRSSKKMTSSERRIVNAVTRRFKPKRKRRY